MSKILIVDDSETLRLELKTFLESLGHSVVEAESGPDGLEKIGQNTDVNLLISDFNMPGMDGISMCKKIKDDPQFAKLPIFMLTTESTPELKSVGKEAGVMAWIVKPFSTTKLKTVLDKILK